LDKRLVPQKRKQTKKILSEVAAGIEKCADERVFFKFILLMCLGLTIAIIFTSRNLWMNKSFTDWLAEGPDPY
jgi:hypothetical protein